MNIALPILLLVFGGLTFWLLTESTIRWYLKAVCISVFCMFTIIFWLAIHTFLGWPAHENDMPEKVIIHWVIVKEPNKVLKLEGAIYFLIESTGENNKTFLNFFAYKNKDLEPRLFKLAYTRELHEQVEKQMRDKLRKGQTVMGKFSKIKNGRKGKDKGSDKEGGGSESQEQGRQFHSLRPSDFLNKPSNED